MAARPEQVRLHLDTEGLTARLSQVRDAVKEMAARFELSQATWEPHDWGRPW